MFSEQTEHQQPGPVVLVLYIVPVIHQRRKIFNAFNKFNVCRNTHMLLDSIINSYIQFVQFRTQTEKQIPVCDFMGSFVRELFLSNQVQINPACCIFKVALHDVLVTRNGGTLQQANNQPLTCGCFSFHQYTLHYVYYVQCWTGGVSWLKQHPATSGNEVHVSGETDPYFKCAVKPRQ